MPPRKKAKIARTSTATSIMVQLEPNVMVRLRRFQKKFEREFGVNLKNAPAVKMLLNKALNVYETSGEQLDLIDAIADKKKKK